ncbi:MAG: CoA activase, partial [Spirochaetaceae bacterium]
FGHVRRLSEQADYVFTPLYLHNNGEKGPGEQQYCYYTQHAPASVLPFVPQEKCISPLVATAFGTGRIKQELVEAFGKRNGWTIGAPAIQAAMDRASTLRLQRQQAYRELYEQYSTDQQTADVVLIGRPYLVLDPIMNKGIPQVFGTLGVRTFFQDMLPEAPQIDTQYRDLLQEVPWYFAKAAIRAAVKAARTPGLYPVYVTAFKCGPDSFAVDFFRRIMEAAGKPYLVLELDEHDSAVGYETRIEAAVRTFRNHLQEAPPVADSPEALPEAAAEKPDSITKPPKNWIQGLGSRLPRFGLTGIRLPVIRLGQVGKLWSAGGDSPEEIPAQLRPWYRKNPRGATLLLPNWDSLTLPLLAAVLRGQGVDARVMPESESLIRRSLHTNTGQCLPMNVIAENYIETVDREGLDPAKTVLWMADANFACNIPLFPLYIRNLIHERGRGFEHTQLYVGEVTFKDISPLAPIHAYFAFLFAGILRRLGCRIRPYEYNPGQTDEVIAECLGLFQQVFENPGVDRLEVVKTVLAKFEAIPYDREARRPKIALFGDFYVRDNDVFNQDIIHTIEAHGGEVITTPYSDFAMMTAENYFARWLKEGQYVRLAAFKLLKAAMNYLEKAYQSEFERVLQQSAHSYDDDASDILARYNLRVDHSGETADNVLKTWYIKKHYPDVALFVQLNPGFCCAGLVTEAIASRIEEVTGVPVVSLTYDAIGGSKNDTIIPYIHAAVNQ